MPTFEKIAVREIDTTIKLRTVVDNFLAMGICKTRTGWLRMADADGGWEYGDGKMRMEKCGRKNKIKN